MVEAAARHAHPTPGTAEARPPCRRNYFADVHRGCLLTGVNASLGHNVTEIISATFAENPARQACRYALERAEQLARRKAIYEALHPETRKGVAQAIGMHGSLGHNVTDKLSVTFVEDTAKKTGVNERSIYRDVQIATRIPDDVRELLRSTPVAERSPRPTPTPSAPRPHPQTGKQGSSFCSSSFCWRHWLAAPQDLHPARFRIFRKRRALDRGLPSDVEIPTSRNLNRRCTGGYAKAPKRRAWRYHGAG